MTPAPRPAWQPIERPPELPEANILIGTSGYYFDDWVGLFNPPRVSGGRLTALTGEARDDQDRLRFYQKYFSFVEINHTFYQEPLLQSFADIEARSKPSMLYAVKAHKDVSHTKTWEPEKGRALMKRHVAAVGPLIETGRFYSFLIQLDDRVERSAKRLDYLLAVAGAAIEEKADVHIEFRNITWHQEPVLKALKDNGVGICNTEIPLFPHVFPLKAYATTDKGYIRYSGLNRDHWYPETKATTAKERTDTRNARYDYLYTLDELKERLKGQLKLLQKTSRTVIAFNNHFQIKAIRNAIQNLQLLKTALSL